MFEEESNNYADKYVAEGVDELKRKVIKGHWQDGAEFGYNKCFEQIKKIVNEDTRLDCIIPELLRLREKE